MPLCNDPVCVNVETLISQRCPSAIAPGLAPKTISSRVRELSELVEDNPYLALSEGLLLAQRLNQPSYATWQDSTTKEKLESITMRARVKLSTPARQERARGRAAEEYLQKIDLGPLEDLRRLLRTYPAGHEAEMRQLGDLLDNYSANPVNQQLLEELLFHLEAKTYLDSALEASLHGQARTRTIRTEKLTPHSPVDHSWHREAHQAAHRLPHWWTTSRDQLVHATDTAVVYLPESRVRRNTSYPWELDRLHSDSALLVLPYAAARLAEIAHGAVVALTGAAPHPHVLEILDVLVSDEAGAITRRELEIHLRTAELLAPQTTATRALVRAATTDVH